MPTSSGGSLAVAMLTIVKDDYGALALIEGLNIKALG
jgi:poly(3-hydroxybutyrate) depolymerase